MLTQSDVESYTESTRNCPRSAYNPDDKSQGNGYLENGSDSLEYAPDNGQFDFITKANTDSNFLIIAEVATLLSQTLSRYPILYVKV